MGVRSNRLARVLPSWCVCVMLVGRAVMGQTPATTPPAAAPSTPSAEINDKFVKAANSTDPYEKKQLALEILAVDSSHAAALALLREAEQQIKQQEAAKAEESKKEQQTKENLRQGKMALSRFGAALGVGNLTLAAAELEAAKRLGVTGAPVQNAERLLRTAQDRARWKKYLTIGGMAALLGSLLALVLVWRSGKEGYVEAMKKGTNRGKRFALEKEITNIGSIKEHGEDKIDIVINDLEGMISRLHCQIYRKNKKYYLVDCNSSNGTWLNGERIRPEKLFRLRRGAHIALAQRITLRFGMERKRS